VRFIISFFIFFILLIIDNLAYSNNIATELNSFINEYGKNCIIQYDKNFKIPQRIFFADKIRLQGKTSQDCAFWFIQKNKDFLKINPKNLKFINKIQRNTQIHILYQQIYNELIVENAYVLIHLTCNNNAYYINYYESFYKPNIEVSTLPTLTQKEALDITKNALSLTSLPQNYSIHLVILPLNDKYYLTWKIIFNISSPLGSWVYYINAHNGDILLKYNNLRFYSDTKDKFFIEKKWKLSPVKKEKKEEKKSNDWQVLLEEDFEGEFPGNWFTYAKDTNYTFGKTDYTAYNGTYSGWCAGLPLYGEEKELSPEDGYPNNMYSCIRVGPFDLSDAASCICSFYYFSDTQPEDAMHLCLSLNGYSFFSIFKISGDSKGWKYQEKDIVSILEERFDDLSSVFIAFWFVSDGTKTAKGVFIDDITLKKYIKPPTPKLKIICDNSYINLGDWVNLQVIAKNEGKTAKSGRICLSFPQFQGTHTIVASSTTLSIRLYAKGDKIKNINNQEIQALYSILEADKEFFRYNQEVELDLKLNPQNPGIFKVYSRFSLIDNLGNLYLFPTASTTLDQQDFYVNVLRIIVDDRYEDNDSLEDAFVLPKQGTYTKLLLKDDDWYKVFLYKNQSIRISTNNADIELSLSQL
jgi:hypothetical protein